MINPASQVNEKENEENGREERGRFQEGRDIYG